MKRMFKFIILICIFTLIFKGQIVSCAKLSVNELSTIRNGLSDIGLDKTSINNIVTYVNNSKLTKAEKEDIVKTAENLYDDINGKESLSDFGINELVTIYKKATGIADKLNIGVSYSFFNKEITIKDKSTGNILVKADEKQGEKYIENIKNFESEPNVNALSKLVRGQFYEDNNKQLVDNTTDKINNNVRENQTVAENNTIKKVQEKPKVSDNKVVIPKNEEKSKVETNEEVKPVNENSNYKFPFTQATIIGIGFAGMVTLIIRFICKWISCFYKETII